MSNARFNWTYNARHQQGAVLLVSLILLMVLTVLGIAAMEKTTLEERMAGNMRDKNLSLNAAEAVLRSGENWIRFNAGTVAAETAQLLDDPSQWDRIDPAPTYIPELVNFSPELDADPIVHVGPAELVRMGVTLPPVFRYIHPITADGVGISDVTVSVVQTHFEPY